MFPKLQLIKKKKKCCPEHFKLPAKTCAAPVSSAFSISCLGEQCFLTMSYLMVIAVKC